MMLEKLRMKFFGGGPLPKATPVAPPTPSMVLAELLAAQIIMDFNPVITEETYGTCKIWVNRGKVPVKWYVYEQAYDPRVMKVRSTSLYDYCVFNPTELAVIEASLEIANKQVAARRKAEAEESRQKQALKAIEKHMGIEKTVDA